MNKNKKKFNWGQWIVFASFLFIGGLCGTLIVNSFDAIVMAGGEVGIATLVIGILLLYVAIFLQIILHEAGHMVFGLLTGYRFCSFRVGSFMWAKIDGKIRFKRMSLPGTGGQCLMAPPGTITELIPFRLYNLGGSLMNLITALLFFLISLLCSGAPWLRLTLQMTALVGLAYAIINGVPLRLGNIDNDGYNAFSLGKNPQAVRAFWIQLKINELQTQGYRMRDLPKDWFVLPSEEDMLNSMIATVAVFASNRLMDEHKFKEASDLIDRLLSMKSGIVGLYHSLMICDRIYCELMGENRPEVLAGLLTKEQLKTMKSMKNTMSVMRTEYALALIRDNNPAKAEKKRTFFLKVTAKYPYSGEVDAELELMDLCTIKK